MECCNTPDVIYLICIPTLVVSSTKLFYFIVVGFLSPYVVILCHASHIMSSCALHLHTCSSHAFEHFPHCPFCIPVLLCPPVVLSTSFRVWVLNVFGLERDLPCGLGLLPVDCLSSFMPFGLRLILQRLTEGPKKTSRVLQPNTLPIWPKTHLNHLHRLERSITIAWPKTALHLELPSSLYAYI